MEAKSRGVDGILGKTRDTGVSAGEKDCTTRLTIQLNEALNKPADGPRLIFIDVNAVWTTIGTVPNWVKKAEKRLAAKEKDLPSDKSAYIFITNAPFHRELSGLRSGMEVLGYGLGMSDFGKPGFYRFGQIYKMKQKHKDAHSILAALIKYPSIPPTFDGKLPSESLGRTTQRCVIGETYNFEDIGLIGTVVDAAIMETQKTIHYCVQGSNGQNYMLARELSDDEMTDYKAHPEAYFGRVKRSPKPITDDYEFFEFILDQHKALPRERLLEQLGNAKDIDRLRNLNDEDLLIEVCERLAASMIPRKRPGTANPANNSVAP